jgi:hypothetical protein
MTKRTATTRGKSATALATELATLRLSALAIDARGRLEPHLRDGRCTLERALEALESACSERLNRDSPAVEADGPRRNQTGPAQS